VESGEGGCEIVKEKMGNIEKIGRVVYVREGIEGCFWRE
jgi:hypothetical protein